MHRKTKKFLSDLISGFDMVRRLRRGDIKSARFAIGDHLDGMLRKCILEPRPDGSSAIIIANVFNSNPVLRDQIMTVHSYYEWQASLMHKRLMGIVAKLAFGVMGL